MTSFRERLLAQNEKIVVWTKLVVILFCECGLHLNTLERLANRGYRDLIGVYYLKLHFQSLADSKKRWKAWDVDTENIAY